MDDLITFVLIHIGWAGLLCIGDFTVTVVDKTRAILLLKRIGK